MLRTRLLPTTFIAVFVLAGFSPAVALPIAPNVATKATASSSNTQEVRYGGRIGGYRGGMYGHNRYGYGWRPGLGIAAGVGIAAATSPYWYDQNYSWYGQDYADNNCGPYSFPGNICVPE